MLFDIRVSRSTSNHSIGARVTSGPSAPVSCTEEGGSATNFEANDNITTASVASPIAPCPSHAASMSSKRANAKSKTKKGKGPQMPPILVCGRFPRILAEALSGPEGAS